MAGLLSVIKACFNNPEDTLGRSEESCHMKIRPQFLKLPFGFP